MTNYLEVVYNEKTKPYTDYPHQLCQYLFERFNMKQGDKLLDVGCGRGDFAKGFKDLGIKVFGIDREKGNSEILKDIEFKTAEIERDSFLFDSELFDFVFSKSVIEHLFEPEHFISECRRVLKPGARIIMMTPDWRSQMRIFYNDPTHVRPYTPAGLRDLLKMYGFLEVSSEIFYQPNVVLQKI